uniref:Uncharacterized protein n=1 Tax=Oryza nivara TaxID=4536 RepID=A0A0E0J4S0_ORYNI
MNCLQNLLKEPPIVGSRSMRRPSPLNLVTPLPFHSIHVLVFSPIIDGLAPLFVPLFDVHDD